MLANHDLVNEKTKVVTSRPDGSVIEFGYLADYVALHNGEPGAELQKVEFDEPLRLFTDPLPKQGEIVEMRNIDMSEDQLWLEKFGIPYMNYFRASA
jgi:hypothetical protein